MYAWISTAIIFAVLPFKSTSCGPAPTEIVKSSPIVVINIPLDKSSYLTFASATTWVAKVDSRIAVSISFNDSKPSSESNEENASFVGANSVKGAGSFVVDNIETRSSLRSSYK